MIVQGNLRDVLQAIYDEFAPKQPSNANTVSNIGKAIQTAPDRFVLDLVSDEPKPEPEVEAVKEVVTDGEPEPAEEVEDQDQASE